MGGGGVAFMGTVNYKLDLNYQQRPQLAYKCLIYLLCD